MEMNKSNAMKRHEPSSRRVVILASGMAHQVQVPLDGARVLTLRTRRGWGRHR